VNPEGGERPIQSPYLTAQHHDLRSQVRAALDRVVLPEADRWEAQRHIPPEGWQAMAGAGLFEFDHSGSGFLRSAVFLEELGRAGYAGIRSAVGVHAYMAPSYLALFGTPDQQSAYLPAVRRGDRVAALAISEQDAGSDLRHLRTRAVPDGKQGYRVTGTKRHVVNGTQAGFFVTVVRTRPDQPGAAGLTGAGLLIIDADLPGVTRTPERLLGYHAADVCQIDFEDVPVPADRLVGRADRTLLYLMRALDFERLVAGLLAVGGALHCIDLLDDFVRKHRVKDAPLSANQAVRHRMAELTSELDLVRHYGYHAAWLHSQGLLDTRTASVLKLRATELAVTAARTCVQYHGARGYLEDSAAARLYRDAAAGTIAAGASELLRDLIFE
jgi:acyl-CoA dehydrogenase